MDVSPPGQIILCAFYQKSLPFAKKHPVKFEKQKRENKSKQKKTRDTARYRKI